MKSINKCKYLCLLLSFFIAVFVLSGCSKETNDDKQVNVAVIVGAHANMPAIQFSGNANDLLKENLFAVAKTYGNAIYISCEGEPNIYFDDSINPPEVNNLSKTKLNQIARENETNLENQLFSMNALATSKETDPLDAISIAAKSLRAIEGDCENRLIIADSGISTAGYLDFVNNSINDIDQEDLIKQLKKADAIPSLEGVSVDWFFMGASAEPQQRLSEKQLNNLEAIWTRILDESGAKYTIHEDVLSGNSISDLPYVSTVLAESRIISPREYEEELEQDEDIIAVLMDADGGVKFKGGEAIFENELEAREKIKEVADILNQDGNQEVNICVIGTTASIKNYELSYFLDLSQRRAETVASVLEEYGVNRSRMQVIGLGYKDEWYQYDINDDTGLQIEEIAQLNRKCIIINQESESCERAREIFNSF